MNRLDAFPRFLLERVRFARSRGLDRFRLTHPTGDVLYVTLHGARIEVVRLPQVPVPGPVGKARMRLVTTEDDLVKDLAAGITSHQAEDWRG